MIQYYMTCLRSSRSCSISTQYIILYLWNHLNHHHLHLWILTLRGWDFWYLKWLSEIVNNRGEKLINIILKIIHNKGDSWINIAPYYIIQKLYANSLLMRHYSCIYFCYTHNIKLKHLWFSRRILKYWRSWKNYCSKLGYSWIKLELFWTKERSESLGTQVYEWNE